MQLDVRTLVDHVRGLVPDRLQRVFNDGLPELEVQLAKLRIEAFDAERNNVPFFMAVRDTRRFTQLSTAHHGLLPMLETSIPPEMIGAFRVMLKSVGDGDLDGIRYIAFVAAAGHKKTADAALWRFLLFQAARMNLWLLCQQRPVVDVVGTLARFDELAEERLRDWLGRLELFEEDVRPLEVVMASLFEDLVAFAQTEGTLLSAVLGEAEQLAIDAVGMRPADKVLLKNRVKEGLIEADLLGDNDEGALEAAELRERHPKLFPSVDALYRRYCELRARRWRPGTRRRGVTLAGLVNEYSRGELSPGDGDGEDKNEGSR